MIVEFIDKIEEADDVQDNPSGDNQQDTNTDTKEQDPNQADPDKEAEVTDLQQNVSNLLSKKTMRKTRYTNELKPFNDRIAALVKQRGELEGIKPENPDQADINNQKIAQKNAQINDLINKKLALKTAYQTDIKNIENQLVSANQRIADNGGTVIPNYIDESMNREMRFSKKLFESVLNKTDEMYAAICLAFDKIDNLSFTPDNTRCKTFAKNIIAYLNKMGWGSGAKEEEFKTFLYGLLNASHLSLARKEKDSFVNNLIEEMKGNALFKWLFA